MNIYVNVDCYKCGIWFKVPDYWHQTKREDHTSFWCPNGHQQHYVWGETNLQKAERELSRAKQQLAQRDDEIAYHKRLVELEKRTAAAYKGQVTKIKKRVGKGVCPCCSRHFSNLERHMASKHPGYSSRESNVAPLKKESA